jgi:hypothetical protein
MTLKNSITTLNQALQALSERMEELRLTIQEDHPLQEASALVDLFGDAVEDCQGWLQDARQIALEQQGKLDTQPDLLHIRRALPACQELLGRCEQRYHHLIAYDSLREMLNFGRRRGGEWQVWTTSVKESLESCQPYFDEIHQALFFCWNEIADRVGALSVSIQANNFVDR